MQRFRLAVVVIGAVAVGGLPAVVTADNPAPGQIFAVGDHVLPGATLTISGGQLEPGDRLTFRLSIETTDLELGDTEVRPDGTITFGAAVPAGTPIGYAEITASDGNGSSWRANVLIGERPEGPGTSAAPAPAATGGPIDDRAIGLLMAGFGFVLALVAVAWWWTARSRESRAD